MKLIHKVEDCAVYKGNDSTTYLLKIPSSLELLQAIKDAGTIKHVSLVWFSCTASNKNKATCAKMVDLCAQCRLPHF